MWTRRAALWAFAPFGIDPEAMQASGDEGGDHTECGGTLATGTFVTLTDEGVVPNPDATRFQTAMFRTGSLELLDPVTLT